MPKIVFRGKTYYSVYEMPPKVRRAYEKEQEKAEPNENQQNIEPAINPAPSEYDPGAGPGTRGLMWGILVALILTGIAFLLSRLVP